MRPRPSALTHDHGDHTTGARVKKAPSLQVEQSWAQMLRLAASPDNGIEKVGQRRSVVLEPIRSAKEDRVQGPLSIELDSPLRADVRALLAQHLTDMRAVSPPGSVHALDPEALTRFDVAFFTARDRASVLLGCGALAQLPGSEAEIKSMRTAHAARGRGVATTILARVLDEARARGVRTVRLETGSQPFFEPARRLYRRSGFVITGPFASYKDDANSVYMALVLAG